MSDKNEVSALIEAINLRFVSGNSVPVERAFIRQDEWQKLKAAITAIGEKGL